MAPSDDTLEAFPLTGDHNWRDKEPFRGGEHGPT